MTVDEVRRLFPGQYELRGHDLTGYAPPEGESFGEVQERTWKTFLDIAAGENTAAIVAHGGVNRAILCRVLDMPLPHVFRLAQDYACVNILRRDATGFVLERMNMV